MNYLSELFFLARIAGRCSTTSISELTRRTHRLASASWILKLKASLSTLTHCSLYRTHANDMLTLVKSNFEWKPPATTRLVCLQSNDSSQLKLSLPVSVYSLISAFPWWYDMNRVPRSLVYNLKAWKWRFTLQRVLLLNCFCLRTNKCKPWSLLVADSIFLF